MARIFLLSFLVGNHNCLWRTQKGFRRRWGMRWGRGWWWGWIQEQTNNLLNTEVRCSNDRLIFVEGGNYTVASTRGMDRVKQHRAAWLMAETTQSHPLHWFSSFLSFSSMTTREEHSWSSTLALSHYPYLLSFSPSYFHFHVATHTCVTRPARKELFMFSCGCQDEMRSHGTVFVVPKVHRRCKLIGLFDTQLLPSSNHFALWGKNDDKERMEAVQTGVLHLSYWATPQVKFTSLFPLLVMRYLLGYPLTWYLIETTKEQFWLRFIASWGF